MATRPYMPGIGMISTISIEPSTIMNADGP
jgi:hypothetical protein